mgnify:FL=1
MRELDVRVDVRIRVAARASQVACDMLASMARTCDTACLQSVAREFERHPNTVARMVRDASGLTFGEVLLEMRMQRAKALEKAGVDVAQASRACGYEKPARFREAYEHYLGTRTERHEEGGTQLSVSCGCVADSEKQAAPCGGVSGTEKQEPSCGGVSGSEVRVISGSRTLCVADTVHVVAPDSVDLAGQIRAFMRANCADVTLAQVAEHFCLHPNTVSSILKRATGATFSRVLLEMRMACAQEMLRDTDVSVEKVACACGYENPASFYRAYRRAYGHAPRSDQAQQGRADVA